MADVVDAPRRQVVEDEHLVAAAEAGIGEMRPDEAGSARDQNAHEFESWTICSIVSDHVLSIGHDLDRCAACHRRRLL